jgi:hypothetical protein
MYVRASPCSLELLQDIRDFVPFEYGYPLRYACTPELCHNILQWLKVRTQGSNRSRLIGTSVQAFPNPPQDVIEIWQNHLKAAGDNWEWYWPVNDPEDSWRDWQNRLHLKGLFLPNQP